MASVAIKPDNGQSTNPDFRGHILAQLSDIADYGSLSAPEDGHLLVLRGHLRHLFAKVLWEHTPPLTTVESVRNFFDTTCYEILANPEPYFEERYFNQEYYGTMPGFRTQVLREGSEHVDAIVVKLRRIAMAQAEALLPEKEEKQDDRNVPDVDINASLRRLIQDRVALEIRSDGRNRLAAFALQKYRQKFPLRVASRTEVQLWFSSFTKLHPEFSNTALIKELLQKTSAFFPEQKTASDTPAKAMPRPSEVNAGTVAPESSKELSNMSVKEIELEFDRLLRSFTPDELEHFQTLWNLTCPSQQPPSSLQEGLKSTSEEELSFSRNALISARGVAAESQHQKNAVIVTLRGKAIDSASLNEQQRRYNRRAKRQILLAQRNYFKNSRGRAGLLFPDSRAYYEKLCRQELERDQQCLDAWTFRNDEDVRAYFDCLGSLIATPPRNPEDYKVRAEMMIAEIRSYIDKTKSRDEDDREDVPPELVSAIGSSLFLKKREELQEFECDIILGILSDEELRDFNILHRGYYLTTLLNFFPDATAKEVFRRRYCELYPEAFLGRSVEEIHSMIEGPFRKGLLESGCHIGSESRSFVLHNVLASMVSIGNFHSVQLLLKDWEGDGQAPTLSLSESRFRDAVSPTIGRHILMAAPELNGIRKNFYDADSFPIFQKYIKKSEKLLLAGLQTPNRLGNLDDVRAFANIIAMMHGFATLEEWGDRGGRLMADVESASIHNAFQSPDEEKRDLPPVSAYAHKPYQEMTMAELGQEFDRRFSMLSTEDRGRFDELFRIRFIEDQKDALMMPKNPTKDQKELAERFLKIVTELIKALPPITSSAQMSAFVGQFQKFLEEDLRREIKDLREKYLKLALLCLTLTEAKNYFEASFAEYCRHRTERVASSEEQRFDVVARPEVRRAVETKTEFIAQLPAVASSHADRILGEIMEIVDRAIGLGFHDERDVVLFFDFLNGFTKPLSEVKESSVVKGVLIDIHRKLKGEEADFSPEEIAHIAEFLDTHGQELFTKAGGTSEVKKVENMKDTVGVFVPLMRIVPHVKAVIADFSDRGKGTLSDVQLRKIREMCFAYVMALAEKLHRFNKNPSSFLPANRVIPPGTAIKMPISLAEIEDQKIAPESIDQLSLVQEEYEKPFFSPDLSEFSPERQRRINVLFDLAFNAFGGAVTALFEKGFMRHENKEEDGALLKEHFKSTLNACLEALKGVNTETDDDVFVQRFLTDLQSRIFPQALRDILKNFYSNLKIPRE